MLSRKVNLIILAMTMYLLSSLVSANTNTSDFVVRLFNNTAYTQPLHYYINPHGQYPLEGDILRGDEHGVAINICSNDEKTEIILADKSGIILWDGLVAFYGNDFYIRTVKLDANHSLGAHAVPTIRTIVFDLMKAT